MSLVRRTLFFALPLAFVSSHASLASAQDAAAAEALFNRGLADMQAGKFDTGCPAIGESYRLDPRAGTLFTLAECEAKAGHYATAVVRYDDYLSLYSRLAPDQQAKQNGRDKIATQKKAELAPLVPQLTLVLSATSSKGTVVKRDDVVLSGPSLGIPLPVDPGTHVVTVQPPGGAVIETKVTIAKGEKKTVTLDAPLNPSAPPPTATTAPTAPPATSTTPGATSSGATTGARANGTSDRRIAAYAAAGVGVAGLAMGAITGGITLGKKSTIDDNCQGTSCNATGKAAADSASTTGLVSTIGFGVGLAGAATAIVLLVTEPKKTAATTGAGDRARPSVGILSMSDKGAVMGIRGAW